MPASDWSILLILASYWTMILILASDWSILLILASDWMSYMISFSLTQNFAVFLFYPVRIDPKVTLSPAPCVRLCQAKRLLSYCITV